MPATETLSSRRFDKITGDFATGEVHWSSPTTETLGSQTGSVICDVAGGAGHLALSFADEHPARLVGLDPAPSMPQSFRAPAAERSVTVETAQAVAEMTRLLRSGGRLAVIGPEANEDPEIDTLNHELEVLHDPTRMRSCPLDEWIGFPQGAGLNVPVARGEQAESRTGVPVERCGEIASSWCGPAPRAGCCSAPS
ncbi:hypothetical protein [Streptomyces sp. H51]|uniref:class I SAM-dependent methyltransferase n=1 Tax=Streptomyces sp. H51 TaxID=3111770 RepID=UPI002D768152|nr:hypothetical protein [Streptomyces sp. H51]